MYAKTLLIVEPIEALQLHNFKPYKCPFYFFINVLPISSHFPL